MNILFDSFFPRRGLTNFKQKRHSCKCARIISLSFFHPRAPLRRADHGRYFKWATSGQRTYSLLDIPPLPRHIPTNVGYPPSRYTRCCVDDVRLIGCERAFVGWRAREGQGGRFLSLPLPSPPEILQVV